MAALVVSMPVRLDDNLSVAATAGASLRLISLASIDSIDAALPIAAARLPAAVALNALVAFAGFKARAVALSGALAGAAIGITIFAGLGWRGWTLLLVTFVVATVASKLGLQRKIMLGIAEERGVRRDRLARRAVRH